MPLGVLRPASTDLLAACEIIVLTYIACRFSCAVRDHGSFVSPPVGTFFGCPSLTRSLVTVPTETASPGSTSYNISPVTLCVVKLFRPDGLSPVVPVGMVWGRGGGGMGVRQSFMCSCVDPSSPCT